MKSKALTPKNYLKAPLQLQKYQCWICYEVCIKPVRCRGSCGHIFCMKCVSDTRNNNHDRCPSRCSSPFLVTPIPDIEVEFFCPYNDVNCKIQIKSLQRFQEHYKTCQFVSEQELRHRQLQSQYRCWLGHALQFFVGSYDEMVNAQCKECGEQRLCRSFCRVCEEFYCVGCRKPPCSKEGCPIGHAFNFERIGVINYICDICGISTAVSNDGVYDDNLCNFGICEGCFKQLPEKYDSSKSRAMVTNINTECSCGHKLIQICSVHQLHACELCKRQKECPNYCPKCNKKYCVGCKVFDIYSDLTCPLGHEITEITLGGEQLKVQNEYGCMRCGKSSEQYFVDMGCFVRLCRECVIYSMKVTTDKQRPISLTCDKDHVLSYVNQDEVDLCCKCQKVKLIKLVCLHCPMEERMYCFQCRGIPLKRCYFGHQLKELKLENEDFKECNFCMERFNEFYSCSKCNFFVCRDCVRVSLSGESQVQELNESQMEAQ